MCLSTVYRSVVIDPNHRPNYIKKILAIRPAFDVNVAYFIWIRNFLALYAGNTYNNEKAYTWCTSQVVVTCFS